MKRPERKEQERKREIVFEILVIIALSLITFLIAMLSPLDIFTKAATIGTDSSVFRYIGWEMSMEKVPYRDFFDHKGPLLFFINYLGTLIARIRGIWIIEVAFLWATSFCIYRTARRFVNRGFSIFVTLLSLAPLNWCFEGGNLTEEYALLFQAVATYIFIDFFADPESYNELGKKFSFLHWGNKWFNVGVFLCGLCFMCVFLLRANMIALWIVFCISAVIYCIRQKRYPMLQRFVISFFSGILFLAIPILIYLIMNHAFSDFIYDYFIFNMQYSSVSGRANLASRTTVFLRFLNTLPLLFSFVIVVVRARRGWGKGISCLFDCSYIFYMLLSLVLIAMAGTNYAHYGMSLCTMYVYPFCILFQYLSHEESKKLRIDIFVLAYLTTTFLAPNWTPIIQKAAADIHNGIYADNENWYDNEIICYISENTTPDDVITVFGNHNAYYLYSERRSASKYFYQFPIGTVSPDIMDEYFRDLEEKLPKVVVVALKGNEQMNNFLTNNNYSCIIEGDVLLYQKS